MVKIFLDLEMNPIPREFETEREVCRSEIIQIGAVALNSQDSLMGEYDQIVKPQFSEAVAPEIYHLTGITTEILKQGISFQEAIIGFSAWCERISDKDSFEIYAWSDSDLIQLQKEMLIKDLTYFFDMKFMNVWNDFQFVFSELLGINTVMSLDKAIKAFDIDFAGNQHNALNDALNTAKLYQMAQNKEAFDRALKPIKDMMEPSEHLSTQMGSVFNLKMFDFGNV